MTRGLPKGVALVIEVPFPPPRTRPSPRACDNGRWCRGWAIFNGDEVQRCDVCKRYRSDDGAVRAARRLGYVIKNGRIVGYDASLTAEGE